jgi:hypothetical protein
MFAGNLAGKNRTSKFGENRCGNAGGARSGVLVAALLGAVAGTV